MATETKADINKLIEEIRSQYTQSRDWLNEQYYKEWAEVYRSMKCRVLPVKDAKGREIKNRTNVALPDHYVMRRRKTARLTRRMPNLRIRGGRDQQQRDQTSALMYRQWDLSKEQRVFRAVVDQASAFGWSVRKGWWNKVEIVRQVRRATAEMSRSEMLTAVGARPDEIEEEIAALGEELDGDEMSRAIAKFGDEMTLPTPTLKYEGPVGERVFIGDFFPEPGFRSLDESGYLIEASMWDLTRLTYWTKLTTTDPDTGEARPIFDEKKVQELIDTGGTSTDSAERSDDLRRQLREAIGQSEPRLEPRLRGRRFPILERHNIQPDGRIKICWIGNESIYLGSQIYPWDTYGTYLYKELVLIPDILGGIGDSGPRISRFLMQLRNARANQINDFINQKLRPKFKVLDNAGISDVAFERQGWSEVTVKNMGDIDLLHDPQFPPEAFQESASLVREQQQVEPLANDFQPGTETIPQPGRLATTAMLQQRAADSLTQDELSQLDLYLADVLNLNLVLSQQAMTAAVAVESGLNERIDALSMFSDGKVRSIQINPLEIQEDMEIIPESGSTLAVNDEFHRVAAQQNFGIATQAPQIFNVREFAKALVQTMPGMNLDAALVPEAPPEPPSPEVRINVAISVKWPELAPDVQVAVLGQAGLPTAGTMSQAMLQLPQRVGGAANAAADLERNPEDDDKGDAGGGDDDAGGSPSGSELGG